MKLSPTLFLPSTLGTSLAAPSQLPKPSNGIHTSPSTLPLSSFDFIIAGGGLTGLTLASRLTQSNPNVTVLVIEAGHDNHTSPLIADVRNYGAAFSTPLDHGIHSTPISWQEGKGLPLIAGNTLGGSGSINGASWTKGPRSQYELLPLLTGDEGWGWEGFNHYMLKAENFNEPGVDEVSDGARWVDAVHGKRGPVRVSFAEGLFGGIQLPALEASERVWPGMQRLNDAASGVANGATIIPNMVGGDESQNRSSPFTAYAEQQVKDRPNFSILTGHRVTEILWKDDRDEDGKLVAAGVRFQACSTCSTHTVTAKREVLLTAGSLQSPQLLELSGVGDPCVLSAAGVELKLAVLGVGKNMQEQTKNTLTHTPQSTEFGGTGPPAALAFPDIHQLFVDENSTAMYDSIIASLPSHAADLAARGLVTNASATEIILRAQVDNLFHSSEPAAEVFFVTDPKTGKVGIDAWNLVVLSRGSVHIRTASAWDHPTVEPNYFGHPFDLAVQMAVCRQSRDVFLTPPLSSLIAREDVPGEAVAGSEDWEGWVKGSFTSVWHYIATAAMMKEELGGVVDARLRVYGLADVRVVDASVVPVQLSAHLSSSLFGVAEKAAVMIGEDWDRRA